MKTARILTILLLALAIMVCSARVSEAAPMGTAFTYQGHLYDSNSVADGEYDFRFSLYADPCVGSQLGSDVNKPEVDVIDGYFTVELDFGSAVFDGNAVWLEIGVRPGDMNDPNDYTALSPRQEVTPTPYALYAPNTEDADKVDGYDAGNSSGQVAVSNGTVCTNLNADKLDGQDASAFAGSAHNHDAAYINDGAGEINTASDFSFAASTFLTNLDADLLDGQHGSYYRNASSLNAGTIAEARLPQNAIDSSEIEDNTLTQADIATNGVGAAEIAAGAVGTSEIANGSVAASDMADGATLSEILDDDGSGSGLDADLLDGSDSTAFASSAHDHDSLYVNITGDSMSGSSSGTILSVSNTGSGNGVNGEATGNVSMGVRGVATNTGDYTNYGGWFMAAGSTGQGVSGLATGNYGRGVVGTATNTDNNVNSGGWFMAAGGNGQAVRGVATSTNLYTNYGGYFTAAGCFGRGVRAEATNSGNYTNYGGWFKAAGSLGQGVYAEATNTGDTINYGGRFEAAASRGRGVYGKAGKAGPYENYGGYFEAAGDVGRGVYGKASAGGEFSQNYGGYFEAAGVYGQGVYGEATNTGDYTNWGGYFLAAGTSGRGVYGRADGNSATGVYGSGGQYDFYAAGPGIDYGTASSIRWKSNIRPMDEALGKVMSIRGVYFNWDAEHGGGHDVGMVAEEVGKVLPEIVTYEENGIDATGMDYGKLTPLLVEAVKALKIEVDEQRKQALEKDVEIFALKKQNEEILDRLIAMETFTAKLTDQQEGGIK